MAGMDEISRRTPSPAVTNNGRMNWEAARWVSRTSRRIGSPDRRRRMRCVGKGIQRNCNAEETLITQISGKYPPLTRPLA